MLCRILPLILFPHTEFYAKYIMCWPGQQAGLILLIHKHKHVHILDIKLLYKKVYISCYIHTLQCVLPNLIVLIHVLESSYSFKTCFNVIGDYDTQKVPISWSQVNVPMKWNNSAYFPTRYKECFWDCWQRSAQSCLHLQDRGREKWVDVSANDNIHEKVRC